MTKGVKLFPSATPLSKLHSTPIFPKAVTQNNNSTHTTSSVKNRTLSPTKIKDKKKNGLYFWCDLTYTPRHKCVKSQLYQMLLDFTSDGEGEDCQECSNHLKDNV